MRTPAEDSTFIPPPTGTLELSTSWLAIGAAPVAAPMVATRKPLTILTGTFSRPWVAGPEILLPVERLKTLLSVGQVIRAPRTLAVVRLVVSDGQLAMKPENFLALRR